MHNIKVTLAYDGTDFHGWQIQPGQPTVQGLLLDALHRLTQERLTVHGAGRTDAGVHAWGQVANFKTDSKLAPKEFFRALNALLPPSVRVRAAQEIPSGLSRAVAGTGQDLPIPHLPRLCRAAVSLAVRAAQSLPSRFRGHGRSRTELRRRTGLHLFCGVVGIGRARSRKKHGTHNLSFGIDPPGREYRPNHAGAFRRRDCGGFRGMDLRRAREIVSAKHGAEDRGHASRSRTRPHRTLGYFMPAGTARPHLLGAHRAGAGPVAGNRSSTLILQTRWTAYLPSPNWSSREWDCR